MGEVRWGEVGVGWKEGMRQGHGGSANRLRPRAKEREDECTCVVGWVEVKGLAVPVVKRGWGGVRGGRLE